MVSENIKAQYHTNDANIGEPSYLGGRGGSHGSVGCVLCVNTGPVRLQAGAVLYPHPGLSRWLVSAPITSLLAAPRTSVLP